MVTTVTAAVSAVPASAGMFAVLVLIGLLIIKELDDAAGKTVLGRVVAAGIVPLLIGFGITVATKVLEVM